MTFALPLALALGVFLLLRWVRLRNAMPPGPLGLPFIGNTYQMPKSKPWRKFQAWNREYGPVVSLFMGSTPVIVLGTAQAAWDLLEKRSDIYSSRPRFIMGRGLMLPNGEAWRRWRKVSAYSTLILHTAFHVRKSDDYRPIQSLESKVMMKQLLDDPRNFEKHIQRYAASVVTTVTYGRRVESVDEWIVRENMKAMEYLNSVNIPGKYLVESVPWLLRLPRSLQWFRKEAEMQKQRDIALLMSLYNDVKSRMDNGSFIDCLTSQTISLREKNDWDELDIAYAVSSPFGAGIETTASTLSVFFLAMLHYPEVMRKAQLEIDDVIGLERMPEFEDKDNLSYLNAVMNETLRWRPVAVLGGTPHAVTVDDEYHGYYIPKGSTIFANLSGILHDPEMFPDPDTFRPERFLETSNPRLKDFDLPFGFGRRICPGMHLARNSIFMNMARILWGFDILPELDGDGREIVPDRWDFSDGFNSRPVSFKCRLQPRSSKVVKCIETEAEMAMPLLRSSKPKTVITVSGHSWRNCSSLPTTMTTTTPGGLPPKIWVHILSYLWKTELWDYSIAKRMISLNVPFGRFYGYDSTTVVRPFPFTIIRAALSMMFDFDATRLFQKRLENPNPTRVEFFQTTMDIAKNAHQIRYLKFVITTFDRLGDERFITQLWQTLCPQLQSFHVWMEYGDALSIFSVLRPFPPHLTRLRISASELHVKDNIQPLIHFLRKASSSLTDLELDPSDNLHLLRRLYQSLAPLPRLRATRLFIPFDSVTFLKLKALLPPSLEVLKLVLFASEPLFAPLSVLQPLESLTCLHVNLGRVLDSQALRALFAFNVNLPMLSDFCLQETIGRDEFNLTLDFLSRSGCAQTLRFLRLAVIVYFTDTIFDSIVSTFPALYDLKLSIDNQYQTSTQKDEFIEKIAARDYGTWSLRHLDIRESYKRENALVKAIARCTPSIEYLWGLPKSWSDEDE
ncbi:hypothetical protein ONZ45_g1791 [Pleurotus djamor]|nr:hypothetical protein ONZ45_g1791 [Pleurotus djamor]